MALIVFEGFDHYRTQADMQARVGKLEWSDIANGPVEFVAGRGGYGYAAAMPGTSGGYSWIGGSFNANYATAIPAVAVQVQPVNMQFLDFMVMDYTAAAPGGSPNGSSGVAQLTFRMLPSSGTILVYAGDPVSGGTLLKSTAPNACSPYIWNKYEAKCLIDPSGSYDFHVNGNSVVSGTAATNTSGNSWLNGLRIRSGFAQSGPYAFLMDDFNLNDTTTGGGTYPLNGFIGDCATRTEFTTANSSVQWTPLANQNWQEVGEVQFDRDTSYNYATTVGDTDLFTFGSLPTTTSVVFGVQLTGAYRKLDASAQTIVQVFSSSGTVINGSAWTMSLDWAFYTDLLVLDPHTSATWTPTAVNALLGGYKLNS